MKLRWDTRLFMGWFGPRGLASIVFVVLVHDKELSGAGVLVPTVGATILLSVLLHGITANSMSRTHGERVSRSGGEI